MNATKLAILFALSLPLTALGCASEDMGDEDAPTTEDELGRAAPSKALSTALLGGPQSGRNEEVRFISVGHLAGSSKACLTHALVWSKAPPNAHWNEVSITVPGSMVDAAVPFLNGKEATTERDTLETRSKTLRYSRRSTRPSNEVRADLEFATSPKGAENLRRVSINVHGTTTACEDLKSLVVLRDSVSRPIVMKAVEDYSRSRRENMDGLEYQGCELLNARTVLCEVGDAAGDRGATFVFSPERGKLGSVRSVEVWRR